MTEDPEKMRARNAVYRAAHREENRAYAAAYYVAHRDEKRAYDATYNAAHAEKKRAVTAAWSAAHPAEKRAHGAAYRAGHPEKSREHKYRRRARVRNQFVAPVNAAAIYRRDRGRCHLCGRKVKQAEASMDHLKPISLGGIHAPWNVALAHLKCNLRRNNRGPAQLLW